MSDETNAIEPRPEAVAIPTPMGSLVPDWWARAYGPRTMYVARIDPRDPNARKTLLAALNEDSEDKNLSVNTDMRIVGYVLVPAARVVEGELQEWVRCVLLLEDGRRVAFGSLGIIKSIMLIEQLDRPAPWNPPIVKRLVCKTIGGAKQWLSLVDPPETAAAANNRKGGK